MHRFQYLYPVRDIFQSTASEQAGQSHSESQPEDDTDFEEENPDTSIVIHQQSGEASHHHSSPPELDLHLILSSDDDVEEDTIKTAAAMLVNSIEIDAEKTVMESFPGIDFTLETRQLAIRLRALLDGKDRSYCDLKSIFLIHPIEQLEIEEHNLGKYFGYASIPEARDCFKKFILSRMKREVKVLNVDLKPFYSHDRDSYNDRFLEDEEFSPIPSPSQNSGDAVSDHDRVPVYFVATAGTPLTAVHADLKKFIIEEVFKVKATEVAEHQKIAEKIDAMDTVASAMLSNIKVEMPQVIKDEVASQLESFISMRLKAAMDKLLPNQLSELKVAYASSVDNLRYEFEQLNQLVNSFSSKLAQASSSSLKKEEEMQGNINSLLRFKEKISTDLSLISNEQVSLNTTVQQLIDNAEKGKEKGKRTAAKAKGKEKKVTQPPLTQSEAAPPAAQKLSEQERAQGEASLIRMMAEAGYTADECENEGKQKLFLEDLRKQRARDKARVRSFRGLESCKDQADKREPTDWLPVEDQPLWDEFLNQFILHHYWLQVDARYTGDTKTAFYSWMQAFPDREFIKRVRAKAAEAKVTINPPKIETFQTPTVCGTDTPDIDRINTFIRNISAQYGCKTTGCDKYKSIRDSIYAAMGSVSLEKIAEERFKTVRK